jgi:hypothetical protein
MPGRKNAFVLACLSFLWCGVASAGTMRCQSVNGNVNCAGSGGVSCQTINGKTTCVSGDGDVVQSFGNKASPDSAGEAAEGSDPNDETIQQFLQQSGPNGRRTLIERDGTRLHLRTDWLSVDRE